MFLRAVSIFDPRSSLFQHSKCASLFKGEMMLVFAVDKALRIAADGRGEQVRAVRWLRAATV